MKTDFIVASTACAVLALFPSNGHAQYGDKDLTSKWLCVVERAVGLGWSPINSEERHKPFVLTIKRIVRSGLQRTMCRDNINYWLEPLLKAGTFDASGGFPKRTGDNFVDWRANIGPHCFASNEATNKFFDEDRARTLVGYDFEPHWFEGQPGNWLDIREDGTFHAGERLGPVVFRGKCERTE